MPLIVRDDAPDCHAWNRAPAATTRPAFTPSAQQADFLDALDYDEEQDLLLRARAGSGKSTTCRQGAWLLGDRGDHSVYACYNAHIAREFQRDLPPTCQASTLHSLGLRLVRQALGTVQVDEDKVDRLAEAYFSNFHQRPERYAIKKLVGLCKNLLLTGEDPHELHQLAADYDVELPTHTTLEVIAVVPEVLQSCRLEIATIDFDDMIWLPIVLNLTAARSPAVLFVDEAQDLNACQHELTTRLCPDGRLVIVGDDRQAIYGFRGADHRSIDNLVGRRRLHGRDVAEYPLTVTRRCPVTHVELARRLVPDLDYLPGALDGEIVEAKPNDYLEVVRPGDMILCRTNAPLVSACYQLIRQDVPAIVRGRDIGKGLLALITRLRCREVSELMRRIGDHRAAESQKYSELRDPSTAMQALHDKCDCLLALCEGASTVDDVRWRAEKMFSDLNETNAVVLSSVHKAKGLERDHIVILRPDLMPGPWAQRPDQKCQELNLLYVAVTRSRRRLTFAGPIPSILTA